MRVSTFCLQLPKYQRKVPKQAGKPLLLRVVAVRTYQPRRVVTQSEK